MTMRVRLTRKLSETINGLDLSRVRTGQELVLPVRDARMLIAEGWASPLAAAEDSAKRGRPPRKRRDPRS
jgi:hypothetical protein